MKRLFWTIGLMSWVTATGGAQKCYVLEPRTGAYHVSAFPAVKGFILFTDSGDPVIRLTHGPNYWTGAQWQQAEVGPQPPTEEWLSTRRGPIDSTDRYFWSRTKGLPVDQDLPDGTYLLTVRGHLKSADCQKHAIVIDRTGPTIAIVSPPQTEKPGQGLHHQPEDPFVAAGRVLPVISGSAGDSLLAVSRVTVFLQRRKDGWWWESDRWFRRRSPMCKNTGAQWRCDRLPPRDSLTPGLYQITVEASDAIGNVGTAFRNVLVPIEGRQALKRPD